MQEVQEDLAHLMKLRQTAPEFQLSVYPPNGSQYVRHRDAFPDDGSDENQRKVLGLSELVCMTHASCSFQVPSAIRTVSAS